MRTGIRRVTVAELHADTEAIIRELPHVDGIKIVSPHDEPLAWLTSMPSRDLTAEEAAGVRRVLERFEPTDSAAWMEDDDGWLLVCSRGDEPLVWINNLQRLPDLTPEEITAIRESIAEFEREDPSTLIDHEEFMRQLDEDERIRQAEGR